MTRNPCSGVQSLRCALFIAAASVTASLSAQAQSHAGGDGARGDWTVQVGAGAVVTPDYMGAKSLKVMPAPVIDVNWRNWVFLSTRDGLGVNFARNQNYAVGAAINYSFGRDDESGRTRGMGEIEGAAQASLFARYDMGMFQSRIAYKYRFGETYGRGSLIEAGLAARMPLGKSVRLSVGPEVTWMDGDYAKSFFSVTPAQSRTSRNRTFTAASGVRDVGITATAIWSVTQHWSVIGRIGANWLVGDAADSPLTEQAFQPSAGAFVTYRF